MQTTTTATASDAREWWEEEPFRAHMNGPDAARSLVVQFGLPTCALCPQATSDVEKMREKLDFVHVHCDAHSDLAAELGVAQLPALLVFHSPTDYTLHQKLRGTDVEDVIKKRFVDQPLDTNADF